jgi:hypothetical protein
MSSPPCNATVEVEKRKRMDLFRVDSDGKLNNNGFFLVCFDESLPASGRIISSFRPHFVALLRWSSVFHFLARDLISHDWAIRLSRIIPAEVCFI